MKMSQLLSFFENVKTFLNIPKNKRLRKWKHLKSKGVKENIQYPIFAEYFLKFKGNMKTK
jgi:hypothetical protein